jgi:hypothetical protein
MNEENIKKFWNNKHPTNSVIYAGRSIPSICRTNNACKLKQHLKHDIKTLISSNDDFLKEIIKTNKLQKNTWNETMLKIQQWVVGNLKYMGDNLNQGPLEYWQFPFETIALGLGDCEDGAVLIASLALNAGIPSYRVRVVVGDVQPTPTAPEGSHAYVSYLRQPDNQWVVVDWCYAENSSSSIENRPILKTLPYYKEVRFSFNNEHCWSNTMFEFTNF